MEAGFDPDRDLGYPGQYPFTRGIHPSYRKSGGMGHPELL